MHGSVYLGRVEEVRDGHALITQKNKFSVAEEIEIMKPDGEDIPTIALSMKNEQGEYVSSCPHPEEKIWLEADVCPEVGDIIRRVS